MNSNLRVYVSATSIDLKDHREEVIKALRKMGMQPACMEEYVAQEILPVDKSLADVAHSDVYVGIFAWRYGFIPPGYDKSITELEFRKASEADIPKLIFLLDESVEWPSKYRDTGKKLAQITGLREEFKLCRIVGWFHSPHQLASEVQSAIHRHFIDIILAKRYDEVRLPATSEQKASLQKEIDLLEETRKNRSLRMQQTTCEPIPINLPRLRGLFVNREDKLDYISDHIEAKDNELVVIIAPSGYGKTELMTKALKTIVPATSIIKDNIKGILYLKCIKGNINLRDIFSESGKIASKRDEFLNTYACKDMTTGKKLEYFFAEMSKVGNVIIVMDNFEDLLDPSDDSISDPDLREFLEKSVEVEHTVRIFVTSRAVPRFKGSRKIMKIDLSAGLPEDEAIRYLRSEGLEYGLDHETEDDLREFVRRVHCIPKALESVLGYLEDHYPAIRFSDILSEEKLFEDFDRHDLQSGLKALIFQQFKNHSPDAKLVLSVLSIFPKPVPQAAVRFLLQGIGEAELASLLSRLERNRLVIHSNGFYDLHPIVRTFIYEWLPEETDSKEIGDEHKPDVPVFTRQGLHKQAAQFYQSIPFLPMGIGHLLTILNRC